MRFWMRLLFKAITQTAVRDLTKIRQKSLNMNENTLPPLKDEKTKHKDLYVKLDKEDVLLTLYYQIRLRAKITFTYRHHSLKYGQTLMNHP